jgi:hypothetical protein
MTTVKQLEDIARFKQIIDSRIKRVNCAGDKEISRVNKIRDRKYEAGKKLGHCACGKPREQSCYTANMCKECYAAWYAEWNEAQSRKYRLVERLKSKLEDAIIRSELPRMMISQAARELRGTCQVEPRVQKFRRWLERRKKTQITKPPKSVSRLAVCACGQPKPLSANYCFDCQDARSMIKATTPLTSSAGITEKIHNYVPKIVTSAIPVVVTRRGRRVNVDYDKTVNPDFDNNGFDNIVKLYEDCRD